MANPPPTKPSTGESARVRCLYCGANNFPSVQACWQCGRTLKAARNTPSAPVANETFVAPPNRQAARPALTDAVNPALAMRAAAALGLLLPFVGIPVGIVFLMLDDPRKVQIGWATLGWSAAGTIINTIAVILPLWGLFKALTHGAPGASGVPGLPNLSGAGGTEIFFQLSCKFNWPA